jgi:hypothetical protein
VVPVGIAAVPETAPAPPPIFAAAIRLQVPAPRGTITVKPARGEARQPKQKTPASLLERLRRPDEQPAWERFAKLYTPLLCHWAQRLGLNGPEVDDLVQDTFIVLVQKLPEFRYDPRKSFRAWLWTVLANKLHDRRRRAPVGVAAGSALDAAVRNDYDLPRTTYFLPNNHP